MKDLLYPFDWKISTFLEEKKTDTIKPWQEDNWQTVLKDYPQIYHLAAAIVFYRQLGLFRIHHIWKSFCKKLVKDKPFKIKTTFGKYISQSWMIFLLRKKKMIHLKMVTLTLLIHILLLSALLVRGNHRRVTANHRYLLKNTYNILLTGILTPFMKHFR